MKHNDMAVAPKLTGNHSPSAKLIQNKPINQIINKLDRNAKEIVFEFRKSIFFSLKANKRNKRNVVLFEMLKVRC